MLSLYVFQIPSVNLQLANMGSTVGPSGSEKPSSTSGDDKTSPPSQSIDPRRRVMATIEDDDERLLARIGYRQVCFYPPLLSLLQLMFVVGTQKGIYQVVDGLIRHFHPRCPWLRTRYLWRANWFWRTSNSRLVLGHWLLYGVLYSKFRSVNVKGLPQAFWLTHAVAELVSAYPTAGGMYFVTKHVVPKEHVALWAWVVGWCNFLGQAAGVASLAYSISQMILAAAVMNSHYEDGAYSFAP